MALVPFEYTNNLLTQWSNNQPADEQKVSDAVLDAWAAAGEDLVDPTLPHTHQYVQAVHQHLANTKAEKREQTEDNIAWHLASHSNRIAAKEKDKKDLLKLFKDKKAILEKKPSSTSVEALKTLDTLIAKADEIKSDPAKLSPITNMAPDLWNLILFDTDYGKKGLANLSGISKKQDPLICDKIIKEINDKKLDLCDLGFYSFKQILKFFGDKTKNLKHISLTSRNKTKWKPEYLFNTRGKEVSNIANIELDNITKHTLERGYSEDCSFSIFINSLSQVESFNIDNNILHSEILSKHATFTDEFIDLCRLNPCLKNIKILNCDLKKETFKKGITKLTSLDSLTVKNNNYVKTYHDFVDLNIPELYKLKELNYDNLKPDDIAALQYYTNLEKAYFEHVDLHDKGFSQITNYIIYNLKNSQIKNLTISNAEYKPSEPQFNIPGAPGYLLPPTLQKLKLVHDCIHLDNLFSSISQSTAMIELELVDCTLVISNKKNLHKALADCKTLKNITVTEYEYDTKLLRELKKAYPNIEIKLEDEEDEEEENLPSDSSSASESLRGVRTTSSKTH
jgi:hypothetical protein